jgi:hypothetical protein
MTSILSITIKPLFFGLSPILFWALFSASDALAQTQIEEAINQLIDFEEPRCIPSGGAATSRLGEHHPCDEYRYSPPHKLLEAEGLRALPALADAVENDNRDLTRYPGLKVADVALRIALGSISSRLGGACIDVGSLRDSSGLFLPNNQPLIARRLRVTIPQLPFKSERECLTFFIAEPSFDVLARLRQVRRFISSNPSSPGFANPPFDVVLATRVLEQMILERRRDPKIPLAELTWGIITLSSSAPAQGGKLADSLWEDYRSLLEVAIAEKASAPLSEPFQHLPLLLSFVSRETRERSLELYTDWLLVAEKLSVSSYGKISPYLLNPLVIANDLGSKQLSRLFDAGKLLPKDPTEDAAGVLNPELLFTLIREQSFRNYLAEAILLREPLADSKRVKFEYLPAGGPYPYPRFTFFISIGPDSNYEIPVEAEVPITEISPEELSQAGLIGSYFRPGFNLKPPREFSWGDLFAHRLSYFFPQLASCPPYAPVPERWACRTKLASQLRSDSKLLFYSPYETERCERGVRITLCDRFLPRSAWPTPPKASTAGPQSQVPATPLAPSILKLIGDDLVGRAQVASAVLDRVERLKGLGRQREAEELLRLRLGDTSLMGSHSINLRGQLIVLLMDRKEWEGAVRELRILFSQIRSEPALAAQLPDTSPVERLASSGKTKEAALLGASILTKAFP